MAAGDVHAIADEALGNTSYLIDVGGSDAAVVDPRRDVEDYLRLAERLGMRIVACLETHLHADFVSGSRELSKIAGSEVIAPHGADLTFGHRAVSAGDGISMHDVTFEVISTPGHTPEHVSYLVTDPVQAIFSGGSLIAGGAARTDLISSERTEELARAQFESLHRVAGLGDDVALHPTHGGGSFCSTDSARRDATTIGEERRLNPLLTIEDEDQFVDQLLAGFGSYPPYFLHLREVNRRPALLEELAAARPLRAADAADAIERGAWLIDGRPVEEWAAGHPKGAISIAVRPQFASWLGWVVPFGEPVILLAGTEQRREAIIFSHRIGYDRVLGWVDGDLDGWHDAGLPTASLELVNAREARERSGDGITLLDVRQRSEWERSRIPGAVHVELGDIIGGRRPAGEVITFCGHGERSATAASLLLRDGVRVSNLAGGVSAWKDADLPMERIP